MFVINHDAPANFSDWDRNPNQIKLKFLFISAPGSPETLSHADVAPSDSHGPQVNLTWSRPAEANGIIRSYDLFYNHSGGSQKKSFGKDTLRYTVDVLGGVTYQFHVRAVTIKPGPNATLTATTRQYGNSKLLCSALINKK